MRVTLDCTQRDREIGITHRQEQRTKRDNYSVQGQKKADRGRKSLWLVRALPTLVNCCALGDDFRKKQ